MEVWRCGDEEKKKNSNVKVDDKKKKETERGNADGEEGMCDKDKKGTTGAPHRKRVAMSLDSLFPSWIPGSQDPRRQSGTITPETLTIAQGNHSFLVSRSLSPLSLSPSQITRAIESHGWDERC